MSKSKWFQKLTPQLAWDQYVNMPVKLFVSMSYHQNITDMKRMCYLYARDIPGIFNQLFTQEQLDRIAGLLEQHINNIGYNEDDLYTQEQVEKMYEQDVEFIRRFFREV